MKSPNFKIIPPVLMSNTGTKKAVDLTVISCILQYSALVIYLQFRSVKYCMVKYSNYESQCEYRSKDGR